MSPVGSGGGPENPGNPVSPMRKIGSGIGFRGQQEDPICPKCQSLLIERPAHPYPVVLQALFALSFVGFLVCFDSIRAHSVYVWIWSAVQVVLGLALTRARLRARRKIWQCVYGCIPSNSALR